MTNFTHRIRREVEAEIAQAENCFASGSALQAFHHLENAHVLAQASTRLHVRVHWLMLRWGYRQRDFKEMRGQVLRLVGAATKTAFGLVPAGNTGGSNISPFAVLPVNEDLAAKIIAAKSSSRP